MLIQTSYTTLLASPPAVSAPSLILYRQRTTSLQELAQFWLLETNLCAAAAAGCIAVAANKWVLCPLNPHNPDKYYILLFIRVSPDDLTLQRWHERHFWVHMRPFLPAFAMVGDIRVGVNVVSSVRTLTIYLKCTVITVRTLTIYLKCIVIYT